MLYLITRGFTGSIEAWQSRYFFIPLYLCLKKSIYFNLTDRTDSEKITIKIKIRP